MSAEHPVHKCMGKDLARLFHNTILRSKIYALSEDCCQHDRMCDTSNSSLHLRRNNSKLSIRNMKKKIHKSTAELRQLTVISSLSRSRPHLHTYRQALSRKLCAQSVDIRICFLLTELDSAVRLKETFVWTRAVNA